MATINSINNKASPFDVDNLHMAVNTLSSTNTNGNIILNPNGTGLVSIASAFTLPRVDGTANQVLKTNGSGVVSWQDDTSTTFPWTVVTGNTQAISVENGYISNNSGQAVVFSLPTTAIVGDEFEVANMNASFGFTVTQAASQLVIIGNTVTTTGAGGSLASSAKGDSLRFVCIVANTTFIVLSMVGNITVV